jgi:SRSO17 transposase
MTPRQIAEIRPRLLDSLRRCPVGCRGRISGLLTDGQRKSMQPMAARLGLDHQRLQQFITSSAWDDVAVRRNVARWFAASFPVEALVVDDTGFPRTAAHRRGVCPAAGHP